MLPFRSQNQLLSQTELQAQYAPQYRTMITAVTQIQSHAKRRGTAPMIFGGYLRDMLLGVPPVDLDIRVQDEWVEPFDWVPMSAADMVAETGDIGFIARFETHGAYASGTAEVPRSLMHVGYYKAPGISVPVNIVRTDKHIPFKAMLEMADFGINQLVIDPFGFHLMASKAARDDLQNRTMTWNGERGLDGLPRSEARARRIGARLAAHGVDLAVDWTAARALREGAGR